MNAESQSEFDTKVRLIIYQHFIDNGRAPTAEDTATSVGCSLEEAKASYHRLDSQHMLVLCAGSDVIRMAMPFSAVPTRFFVSSGKGSWWANCVWDALGIPALLHADVIIETSCGDCGYGVKLVVEDGQLVTTSGLIHFALPAATWWDDVGYT